MNRRTLFTVVGGIIILVLLGASLYFFLRQPSTPGGPGLFPGISDPIDIIPTEPGMDVNIELLLATDQSLPRLYRLHGTPVAGIGFHETGSGDTYSIIARYIEQALGHIYDTDLYTYREGRILNETRSKISEALWGRNGQSVVIRSLENVNNDIISSKILNIVPQTSLPGSFLSEEILLPNFIPFMDIAGDGSDAVFYLQSSISQARGLTINTRGAGTTQVFSESFTEWLPQFPNARLVTLTTRPSAGVPGFLYFLDPVTRNLRKVLSDVPALTTLTNTQGTWVLYGSTPATQMELFAYNVQRGESVQIPLATLPEKCVWARAEANTVYCAVPNPPQSGILPDRWYQGVIAFSDELWKVDVTTGATSLVLTPVGASFDMTNLSISSDDTYIVFVDKETGFPWVFRTTVVDPGLSRRLAAQEQQRAAQEAALLEDTPSTPELPPEITQPTQPLQGATIADPLIEDLQQIR